MIPKDLNTPVWQLSIGEFMELLKERTDDEPTKTEIANDKDKWLVYGYAGLANLLGVSKTTAWKIISSGEINEAVTQRGRTIVIDAALALELIKRKN